MKTILVVTDSIDSNAGSGPKANVAMIENLMACGYQVLVLHNTNSKNIQPAFEHIKIKIQKWSPLYLLGAFIRVFFRHTKINLNKWIELIAGFSPDFFSTCGTLTLSIMKQSKKFDLVITLSQGASFRPHYAALKCTSIHQKWLAYIHDPYPFHYYPRPYNWVQPGYMQKEIFFSQMAQKARWFAFPSKLLMEWMGTYFPEMEKKGILIPHQISDAKVQEFNTSHYWNPFEFNLLHAGNLLKQRPADGLINGFKLFLKNHPEAISHTKLHLIGPADYHAKQLMGYEAQTPQLKLNMRGISFQQAYWLQQDAAVNIILESKSEISPFLPGKFPHCIIAGKPVLLLSPYYSETRRLLGESYPYWCEQNNTEKIAAHIGKLYARWHNKTETNFEFSNELKEYLSYSYLKQQIDRATEI